ncbi:addiction module antidote protein [Bradyrhizobium sp. CCBAU 51753]|uniref:addiction module antidote protein n=1 Tax=Bradyrhizobium sp. CCBAU 51753 TaxID=1325100 RepID=UPI00188C292E|nr:addiction module antidote protein [Bradyrhizobium sp. CCBAU 51753]QOZ24097.1 putative addiction module antidote protein [Bradyrhizobium sp. CCBAU 51753]
MPIKTTKWNLEEHFTTPESQRALLDDALETGDAGHIANAIGIIARARGITEVAEQAGVTRMALYKGLTKDGDPKLSTVLGVLEALGYKLTAKAA